MITLFKTLSAGDRRLHSHNAALISVLMFCSFVCCCTFLGRRSYTGEHDYRFLIWNLFLAWVPLGFATLAHLLFVAGKFEGRRVLLAASLFMWLLFFPNAPYLISDLKHLAVWRPEAPLWFDAIFVGSFVLTGIVTGFASLVLVHDLARRRFGTAGGWATVTLASLASGFGIYLGRFVRLNSWDVFTSPLDVAAVIVRQITDSGLVGKTIITTTLYGAFILLGYLAVMMFARVAAAMSEHHEPEASATVPSRSRHPDGASGD